MAFLELETIVTFTENNNRKSITVIERHVFDKRRGFLSASLTILKDFPKASNLRIKSQIIGVEGHHGER